MFKTAVLFLLFFLLPFAAHGQDNILNILYTGGIKGEIEPCGCSPKTESGGLARLAGYVSAGRKELNPYVLVDAGNSMSGDTPQGRLKSEALLKSFGIIRYDAVALSKSDGITPESFLSLLVKSSGVQVVSEAAGNPVSASFERGPFKVNIGIDERDYKKGSINILLTDRQASLDGSIEGWEVVVSSSGHVLEEPARVGKAIVVSGYPKGRKLGILTLVIDGNGKVADFSHRWQLLGRDINEDAGVRGILNEYDEKVASLLKDEGRKAVSGGPYLGSLSCVECHRPFMESWKKTRHAGAFGSLEKTGKSRDPECVKCHSTGYGEDGGFYSLSSTPGLADVQCEACHGPGRGHALDYNISMGPVFEQVCLRCHTGDNSPDFNFNSYYEKIRHR